jgi:hypothetical protein
MPYSPIPLGHIVPGTLGLLIRHRLAASQCIQYFRLPFVYRSG